MLLICPNCHQYFKVNDSLPDLVKNFDCVACDTVRGIAQFMATPVYETDIYALYETCDGWYADAGDNGYEWFDYPDIRFDRDMTPCFRLEPDSFEGRVDLDVYRSFLDVLDSQIVELSDHIKEAENA